MSNELKEEIAGAVLEVLECHFRFGLNWAFSEGAYDDGEADKEIEEAVDKLLTLVNQKEKEARAKEAEWSLSNLELVKGQSFNDGLVYKNQLDRIKQLKEELNKGEQ